jgi:hypothetical protein
VDVPVELEIDRQVVVRVPPPLGADHPQFPTSQPVPQRSQHAQLVGNPLNPATLVDDRVAPLGRDHPVEGDDVLGVVEADRPRAGGVAAQQGQGIHDGTVGGVVRPDVQSGQQRGKQPAVVVRVRRPQHRADPGRELVGHLGRIAALAR